jgi:integrase
MAKGMFRLSAADLRRNAPGLYGDGYGLWLQVTLAKDGTRRNRSWVFRYTANGRVREMGLGSLATLGLAEARERARQCRVQRLDGIDPIEHRRQQRAATAAASMKSVTFEAAALAYIAAHRETWRSEAHAQQWPSSLRRHVFPTIGSLPVAAVDTAAIVKALTPVWGAARETASRLRGRIESILDWATVAGYRTGDNPARWGGHLEHVLPAAGKRRVIPLAAMAWQSVPGFVAELRNVDSVPARALEFAILTAARRGEVRGATWGEVSFEDATWTVPAQRMKAGKGHRVPLSPRALAILRELRAARQGDHVFPGRHGGLGESAFEYLLKQLGHADITMHGFRSSFRTWAGEATAFAPDVCEAALAHTVGNKVRRAYQRGDLFNKRRRLMVAWSGFCANPPRAGAVVTLLRKGPADAP